MIPKLKGWKSLEQQQKQNVTPLGEAVETGGTGRSRKRVKKRHDSTERKIVMDSCKKRRRRKRKKRQCSLAKGREKRRMFLRTTTSKGGWAGCEQVGG